VVRTGGGFWVWGYNYTGQVGDVTEENNRNTPFNVPGIGKTVDVAIGHDHTLALT